MKAIHGVVAALILVLGSSGDARAQDWWWGITYQMSASSSLPGGSGSDVAFVQDFSFRGVGIEARYLPRSGSKYSFGFSGSWNALNETSEFGTDRNTIMLPNAEITGTQLRYFNAAPVLANAAYYFGKPGDIRPYVSLNAGVYYIERQVDIGVTSVAAEDWHFGWAPEAGLVIPFGNPSLALLAEVRYNWAFSAGGTGDQRYWSLNLGVAYR